MLRGFFVIFVLCMIAMVAVLGFRGQKSFASSWHGPSRLRNAETEDGGLTARHDRRRAGGSAYEDRFQCRN